MSTSPVVASLRPGDRVRLNRAVEMDWFGTVPRGLAGTVTAVETDPTKAPYAPVALVLLDDPLPLLEEWGNVLQVMHPDHYDHCTPAFFDHERDPFAAGCVPHGRGYASPADAWAAVLRRVRDTAA